MDRDLVGPLVRSRSRQRVDLSSGIPWIESELSEEGILLTSTDRSFFVPNGAGGEEDKSCRRKSAGVDEEQA